MTEASPATDFSVAVLGEFVRLGVRNVVLSPGSRSQALALAAAEFDRAGLLALNVRIDERVAGFLALGIAVETRAPVLVITTSGTAVGNLLPAVLEAHHSGVPLILLTADRPEELRGIGSNQTTEQLGMFGDFVRFAREVEAPSHSVFDPDYPGELAKAAFSAAAGHSSTPGPVHLNLAFREPLSGPFDPRDLADVVPGTASGPVTAGVSFFIGAAPATIVIAGHTAGESAEAAARALGAPLVAEVSSGAHFGPNLVVAYRELLGDLEFGGRVRRVIVFGHPTLSREVPAIIGRTDVETIVVRGRAVDAYNPDRRVSRFVDGLTVEGAPDDSPEARAWLGSWVTASRAILETQDSVEAAGARTDDRATVAEFARAQLAVFREPVSRRMLVDAVWQKTWPHDRLIFGASRLIREADRVVGGKKIPVHSNRGLSGIDGTIATATGIALASQAGERSADTVSARTSSAGHGVAGMTRVLLGDLALLHDVGALLIGDKEPAPRMQLIVGNDGGGTIFDSLEVAATAHHGSFDRVLYTPQSVKLSALAEGYGWDYLLARNRGELDEALSTGVGRTIIEVPLPRE